MPGLANVTATFGKRVGPLKVWHYGAIIGGGYLLYKVLKGKGVSLTGSTATDLTATPDAGAYAGPGTAYSDGGPAPLVTPTVTPIPAVPATPTAQTEQSYLQAFFLRFRARNPNQRLSFNQWLTKKYIPGEAVGKYRPLTSTYALNKQTEALSAVGQAGRAHGTKPVTRLRGTRASYTPAKLRKIRGITNG